VNKFGVVYFADWRHTYSFCDKFHVKSFVTLRNFQSIHASSRKQEKWTYRS